MFGSCRLIRQLLPEGKLEMARFMKSENEPIEKIMKYTGLTKEAIGKL